MEYQDRAPTECYDNTTDSIQLYIILAKRIQANNNQTITEMDLTRFGDGVVEQYGLKESACKNFLIFIGVEVAKMAYVRTGSDLKLPPKLMEQIFNQYNLFKAKNFTEVLNKIIDEIGEKISDPNQVTISNGTKTETDELIHNLLSINETTVAQNSSNSDTLAIIYNPAQQPTSW
ncbi:hypothetical protein M3Y97_00813600 [Aphelenchoides bicaudatus]|nr:hypothetical protein M3Y97_00813600 [Aphelenchoides bicaudatus]